MLVLAAIAGYGLLELHSAFGPQDLAAVQAQGGRFLLATAVMIALAQTNPVLYRRWALWAYLATLLLVVAVKTKRRELL